MKQHITTEQLNNFLEETPTTYEEKYDLCVKILNLRNKKMLLSEYFTIGKMIEILDGHLKTIYTPNGGDVYSGVFLRGCSKTDFRADCLCDALWEAVKFVLIEFN